LTRMCTGRPAASASACARRASVCETSAAIQPCCWPSRRGRAAATSASTSPRRASTVTSAPSRASSCAAARPMPSEAPQTRACLPSGWRSVGALLGGLAEAGEHQRAQRFVAAGLRRDDLGEAEAARQRVLLVEAVEFNELRVEQRGTCGVLAVVGQGVAVAVEYFGSAGLEHAQAGPDDVAAQRRQPPLLLAMRAHG